MTTSRFAPEQSGRLPRLLLVDDQALNIRMLHNIFQEDHEVFCATSGQMALEFCQAKRPDLILLDVVMSEMNGYEVCLQLKRDPLTADIPVIFVTAYSESAEEEKGLAAGAVDFIAKSANHKVMRARVKTHLMLKRQTDMLRANALIDGLTGVANRRYFDEALTAEWRRCARSNRPLSLIMIDLDFFKLYNDHYGHQAGDVCLKRVATSIKATLSRSHDVVARYGGEEFVCVLPETPLEGAEKVAAAMHRAVLDMSIPHALTELPEGVVTISLGVAVADPAKGDSPAALLLSADRLLYGAKQAGRGRARVMRLPVEA